MWFAKLLKYYWTRPDGRPHAIKNHFTRSYVTVNYIGKEISVFFSKRMKKGVSFRRRVLHMRRTARRTNTVRNQSTPSIYFAVITMVSLRTSMDVIVWVMAFLGVNV
jgi:hypothetical protein